MGEKIAVVALRRFPLVADDVGARSRMVEVDELTDVPAELLDGLVKEGYVRKSDAAIAADEIKREAEETRQAEAAELAAAHAAAEEAAKKATAARELVDQFPTMEWNEFIGRSVEILGKEARGKKKEEVVAALEAIATPKASAD